MDIGTRLRAAREQRGLTLEGVSASTKMSRHTLALIDADQFERLPGGILTRGYLRAYAAAVGLDPERIVADYREQWFGEAAEALPIAAPPPVEGQRRSGRRAAVQALVLAAVVAVVWAEIRQTSGPPAAAPSATTAVPRPEDRAGTGSAVVAAAAAAPLPASGIRIEIRPEGPCWVSVSADDRLVLNQLLQPGEQAVATARDALVLRVGEPAACLYWVNGAPGRQLGPAGTPVTVQITEDNLDTFLADRPSASGRPDADGILLDASRRVGGLS